METLFSIRKYTSMPPQRLCRWYTQVSRYINSSDGSEGVSRNLPNVQRPQQNTRKVACLVGSRTIDLTDVRRIETIGRLLNRLGYTGRSGNAMGSDIEWDKHLKMLHILPHNGHRSSEDHPKKYHDNQNYVALEVCPLSIRKQALEIIGYVIPNFDDRPESHRNLHLRNVFQPLGLDLKDHAKLTVYTAPETSYGTVAGGTRSAVMISRNFGIPTYNLRIDSQFYQLKEILENELKTQIDNDNKS